MGSDANPERLVARADRLDAFARRVTDDLDDYVRQRAKRHRDEYKRAGIRTSKCGEPGEHELGYSVEIICIEPDPDGEGTRRVTLDVTAAITETDQFETWRSMRQAALEDAETFRRRAAEQVFDSDRSDAENVERIRSMLGDPGDDDVVAALVDCSTGPLSTLATGSETGTTPDEGSEQVGATRVPQADREAVLGRDGNVCRRCGDSPSAADLVVHRVPSADDVGPTDADTVDHLENLIALCETCHDAAHEGPDDDAVHDTAEAFWQWIDAGGDGPGELEQTTFAQFVD